MKAKPKRGGRRPGAGRPAVLSPEDRKYPATVELTIAEREHVVQLGGTVSAGVRRLVQESMKQPQAQEYER